MLLDIFCEPLNTIIEDPTVVTISQLDAYILFDILLSNGSAWRICHTIRHEKPHGSQTYPCRHPRNLAITFHSPFFQRYDLQSDYFLPGFLENYANETTRPPISSGSVFTANSPLYLKGFIRQAVMISFPACQNESLHRSYGRCSFGSHTINKSFQSSRTS